MYINVLIKCTRMSMYYGQKNVVLYIELGCIQQRR